MEVRIYNVGHGDCFALVEGDSLFVVDCGTNAFNQSGSVFTEFINFIYYFSYDIEMFEDKTALITHFHTDHLYGYRRLAEIRPNLFDMVLLPSIFIDETARPRKSYLIEAAIFVYSFLGEGYDGFLTSENLLKQIYLALNLSNGRGIRTLSQGDSFFINHTDYSVLWPPKRDESFFDYRLRVLIHKLRRLIFRHYPKIEEIKNSIVDNMANWYQILDEYKGHNINEQRRPNMQLLQEIESNQSQFIDSLDHFRESERYDDQIETVLPLVIELGELMDKNNNKVSVVFDTPLKPLLLFTGDISPDIIKSHITFNHGIYHIVKVPHHGTKNYYSPHLPEGHNLLIPTGRKGDNQQVSHRYRDHGKFFHQTICSSGNGNCEALDRNKPCQNGICHVSHYLTIKV